MPKLVAYFELKEMRWNLDDSDVQRLRERFPGMQVVSVEDPAHVCGAIADADIYFGFQIQREHFLAARQLRWVHLATAGVEENLFPEMVASDVLLTNSTGLHSVCIPEHVLGQMFVLARSFHQTVRLQDRHEWNRWGVIANAGGIRELNGGKLAILGAGAIGQNLARLAACLGMTVRVMRRDASRPLAHVERVVPPEQLKELLGWADWIVCALPMTAATRRIIGAEEIAAMRPDAFFINVGRGESVDEEALADALRRGALAGAAVDVFTQEPLPSDHPFWTLPNLVLTPHISGYTPNYFQKMQAIFEDNLERWVAGTALRNVVDKQLGYARA